MGLPSLPRGTAWLGAAALAAGCLTPRAPLPAPPEPREAAAAPVEERPQPAERPEPAPARGQLVACGRRFDVDAPVVLWTDPGGYDATSTAYRFGPPANAGDAPRPGELRYTPGRETRGAGRRVLVRPGERDVDRLASVVDQLVLHYDACGLSRTCFEVLHDRRGLSVHFMLDLDGTIYQTMDLRDQAWHAAKANPRSIGIEIANLGAFAPGQRSVLDDWYVPDPAGTRIVLPDRVGDGGLRSAGFVARPARARRVSGRIHGRSLVMYDFTPEQYDSLVALTVALCRALPAIEPEVPRDREGRVRWDVLPDGEYERFRGILGHYHLKTSKVDPGPAFDWEGFLLRVRRRLVAPLTVSPGRGAALRPRPRAAPAPRAHRSPAAASRRRP